ncbi:MAG: GH116 family glycosyl-hydrolase [Bacteroidota bacterium]|nr:GH116 family glycosyl-hydrolase [Bacteroidota bacterium]
MIKLCVNVIFIFVFSSLLAQNNWPIVKKYDQEHISKIAMPIGGIGTGIISLGGNGEIKDLEIMNKPAIGFNGSADPKNAPFFMIFTSQNGVNKSKALLGPTDISQYEGHSGSWANNHGFPRFRNASFEAAYPLGTVILTDNQMPVSAKIKAFNPFIPGNVDESGLPIAVFYVEVENTTNAPIDVSVAFSMENFIGMDGSIKMKNEFDNSYFPIGTLSNKNVLKSTASVQGIFMYSDSVPSNSDAWGSMGITTDANLQGYTFSSRTELDPKGWNSDKLELWTDFSEDGIFTQKTYTKKQDSPRGAIALKSTIASKSTKRFPFYITWHFPNRMNWNDKRDKKLQNYYTTKFTDAFDAANKIVPKLSDLENKTLQFINAFCASDMPSELKEAALFNASTLRSQTCFRLADGNFFGWEGVFNSGGSCYGNCTHVWNYEQASPFLFGQMAISMRNLEYNYGLDSTGLMSFRLNLPLTKDNWKVAAADGQMGTIMKVYREWQLSGDDAFLKKLWPGVKNALSYSWVQGGWDADKDGVMEGCQHNTMDIEYFGPNPLMEFMYLGALKAAEKMAIYLNDKPFAATCNKLFTSGSQLTDKSLFNGEYYIQKIQPQPDKTKIAKGLIAGMGGSSLSEPDFQLGEGCETDQLLGQYLAHICDLGYLTKKENIQKTYESILKYNYIQSFDNHFNNMRTYALGDESGLLLGSYPYQKLKSPFTYYAEVWTGIEYSAATGMIYESMEKEAIKTIKDVRDRYDGKKRNPFNEPECGFHYTRAMASWGSIVAYTGFNYSGVTKTLKINNRKGTFFWSNGYAFGTYTNDGKSLKIKTIQGKIEINNLEIVNTSIALKKLKKRIEMGQEIVLPFK